MSDYPIHKAHPTKKEWAEMRVEMEDLLDVENQGQYTHNMISCQLKIAATKFGMVVADQLIQEFRLTELYGIEQEIVKQVGKALEGE